jgi:beta-glucosidase
MKIHSSQRQLSILLIVFLAFAASDARGQSNQDSSEIRAGELLSKLTLDEKISLLAGTGFDTVAITRLGIPAMHMTDGPAGVRIGPATSFPSPIALASTFDPDLVYRIGKAIAQEAKAKGFNVLLGPAVNIQRVPQAGRNFETFGEDPYLASRMAVAYIRGVQSENVVATVKHFAANNQETDRHTIDTIVDERTLQEIYLPAFRAAVLEGDVWAVMSAYNKLNGFYASESDYLLNKVLKKDWGFKGMVMSDWGAVHSTVPTIRNGLDLEMPTNVFLNPEAVKKALAANEITEEQIDGMVRRILRTLIVSGILDGRSKEGGSIDTPEHRALARKVAAEGVVLLKNKDAILPLDSKKLRSIALIGPNADEARIGGGGSAQVVPYYSVSPADGVLRAAWEDTRLTLTPGIVALEDTQPIPAENLRTPDGKERGLRGEYFANQDFEGEPAFVRTDEQLNFRWATGSPAEGFPADKFSNRWTGKLISPVDGKYSISLSSNDGGRLWIDDELTVDVWGDHATLTGTAVIEMKADVPRTIRVDHYESIGNADLVLGWRLLEEDLIGKAAEAAKNAEVAIVFAGLSDAVEAESRDRKDLNLPKNQVELIEAVAKANPNTIVVLTSGAPILVGEWLDDVKGYVQTFYYGQEGGNAIADVLFGKVNPSGKLPATWLKRWEDSPSFGPYPGDGKRVEYTEGIFTGYRWFDREKIEPEFPFGHGLSYTTFSYSSPKARKVSEGFEISFEVKNTGKVTGAEVSQLYIGEVSPTVPRPVRELKAFAKTELQPGKKRKVRFLITPEMLGFYDPRDSKWKANSGKYRVSVGSSSRLIRFTEEIELDAPWQQ